MDTALMIAALNRALGHQQLKPDTLRTHANQGSHYRATDYRDLLAEHKISPAACQPRAAVGVKAVVKSFFFTLKLELQVDESREVSFSTQDLTRAASFWSMINTTVSDIQRSGT